MCFDHHIINEQNVVQLTPIAQSIGFISADQLLSLLPFDPVKIDSNFNESNEINVQNSSQSLSVQENLSIINDDNTSISVNYEPQISQNEKASFVSHINNINKDNLSNNSNINHSFDSETSKLFSSQSESSISFELDLTENEIEVLPTTSKSKRSSTHSKKTSMPKSVVKKINHIKSRGKKPKRYGNSVYEEGSEKDIDKRKKNTEAVKKFRKKKSEEIQRLQSENKSLREENERLRSEHDKLSVENQELKRHQMLSI